MLSRYITFGISAVVAVLVVGMGIQIKTLSTKNDKLITKLAHSELQSGMQANIIDQLTQDREYINQLLTERAKRSAKEKEKLRDTIKSLKADMRNIECSIPESVTLKLRKPY